MSSEQDILNSMPRQYHDDYINSDDRTLDERIDELGDEIMADAVDAGREHMRGRLNNVANQAAAYREIMAVLRFYAEDE